MIARERKQVLIVDDNQVLLEALREALDQLEDVEVVGVASDASEALAIARSQPVDMVLVDIRMPGLSGIDLTRILRVENPEMRVVLMSAYEPGEQTREAQAAGAAALLDKTEPTDHFVSRVREIAHEPSGAEA